MDGYTHNLCCHDGDGNGGVIIINIIIIVNTALTLVLRVSNGKTQPQVFNLQMNCSRQREGTCCWSAMQK